MYTKKLVSYTHHVIQVLKKVRLFLHVELYFQRYPLPSFSISIQAATLSGILS